MKKRLDELLLTQAKYQKKAQQAGAAVDQLKRDILFEENNAIASKVREMGISPADFDKFIVQYMAQNKEDSADAVTE